MKKCFYYIVFMLEIDKEIFKIANNYSIEEERRIYEMG